MSGRRKQPTPAELEAVRKLIASVEELRAMLARLTEQDRLRVIEFARSLMPDEHRMPGGRGGR